MRIALVHNLQTDHSEAQAEFDTVETIAALAASLERLGHEVAAIDVSTRLGEAIVELERFAPELVFNTAEGHSGPLREALFPALFEELGLAYTGSGPVACATTLDKHRTKAVVAAAGIPTPHAVLIEDVSELADLDLESWPVPAIVKPNFEGSSKGVTADSIVHDARRLPGVVETMLERYGAGVLVESFITGRDVTVPWLETAGVLPAAEYVFEGVASDCDAIYDYDLKQDGDRVAVRVPARLDAAVARDLVWMSERIVAALGIRDVARLDFRVTEDGEVWFLEVNALPSFEPSASLYESAAVAGLSGPDAVVAAVVASAIERQRPTSSIAARALGRRARPRPRVGLIYNLRRVDPRSGDDRDAEFDSRDTISAVAAAIERQGFEVAELEADARLAERLPRARLDLAFNLAEGVGGRSREAQVPALLELLGIPHTGSDAATMSATLDKSLAKSIVAAAEVPTPAWAVVRDPRTRLPSNLTFPVFVKPLAEGSSKGIDVGAVVHDEASLRERLAYLIDRYEQPALVESYLPGREFTVGLLESVDPVVLPPMEIVHVGDSERSIYTFGTKLEVTGAIRYDAPARVSASLRQALGATAQAAFMALGCRDFARIDLRLDAAGQVHFLECNPLPGLTPGWSDLCMIATSAGLDYDALIASILAPAVARAGLPAMREVGARHERAR